MLNRIAAGLALFTAAIHFFLGGADALNPMLAAELPPESSAAMHACWHIVSVFLIWSALVFFRGKESSFHFGVLWVASAIVFIYVGIYQAGFAGVVANPQWTLLLPTGVLALLARRKHRLISKESSN